MCDVSVVIPVYNIDERALRQCVNSIIEQKGVNFEIFIIDDGSKEKCAQLCDSLRNKNHQIEVIHQSNQGVSVARNEGIQRAKGKWIAFVDGDDWIEPDMLSAMVECGNRNKADIVLCDCYINYSKKQIKTYFFDEKELSLANCSKERFILQFMCSRIYNDGNGVADSGAPWAKLYRSSFIRERKLCFHKELRRMQDNIFNLYAYEYAKSIVYIHKPLYHYRKSINSGFFRYNPDIAAIYDLVFKEISNYIFLFNKDSLFNDALNYKVFYSIYVILNMDILNKNNPNPIWCKRRKILAIIDSPYYAEAIKGMKIRYLNNMEKKFFFLVKHKLFFGMYMAVKIKKVVYAFMGKGIQR